MKAPIFYDESSISRDGVNRYDAPISAELFPASYNYM